MTELTRAEREKLRKWCSTHTSIGRKIHGLLNALAEAEQGWVGCERYSEDLRVKLTEANERIAELEEAQTVANAIGLHAECDHQAKQLSQIIANLERELFETKNLYNAHLKLEPGP